MKRTFFFLILITVMIMIHPVAAMLLGVIFGLRNKYPFYELIALGVIIDVMYQTIFVYSWVQFPIYSLVSLIIFFSLSAIKSRLSFHA